MKVLVCGGRDYKDAARLNSELDSRFNCGEAESQPIDMLIHGGAHGADNLAGRWAFQHGVMEVIVPANWTYFGKGAGLERNLSMLRLNPDLVIAFPGGVGTAHMVKSARAAGVEVHEVPA